MFLYEFAEKTAQKPDTVATYVRRNKKIFKNHVERRQKQIWLDEKAVDILLKKYPEVQKKQKKPLNKERFDEIITKSLKTLYENQEILAKEIDEIRALVEELEESFDHHVFWGGKTISYNLLFLLLVRILFQLFLNFSSMINLILVTFLPVLIGSNSIFISVNSLISVCAFSKTFTRKSL